MPFIIRNGSNSVPFTLQDQYLDLIIAADEHVDLEQVFPEDQLYMSSVSPNALYTAINNGDIVRRDDTDTSDIAIINAFDDAIWRWSPTREQKEALVGQPLSPNSTNKYLTQGVFSLKCKVSGTARFGDLILLEGSNITLTDDGLGNFTIAASNVPSFGSPVTLVPDGGNVDGTLSQASRADHKHDIPAASAVSVATTNTEGTSTSLARADHTHQGIHSLKAKVSGTARYGDIIFLEGSNITITDDGSGNFTIASTLATSYGSPVALSPDSGNIDGTLSVAARADHKHDLPADAPTTTLSPATTNTEGTTTSISRADHIHAVATALSGVITTIQPDDVANSGTQNSYARGDHKHAIVADPAVSVGTTNAEGTSTAFSRADHLHQGIHSLKATAGGTARYGDIVFLQGTNITISDDGAGNFTITAASISYGSPVALVPDGGNVDGTLSQVARADHKHDLPADVPTTTLSPATTNAEGTTTSVARADHIHAVATALAAVITTIQPDDVAGSGTQNSYSRGDHRHAIVADAPVTTLSPATTNAEGTTTSFSRADHTHAVATALAAVITTIQPDDVAGSGTQNSYARGDHRHAIVADPAVSVATTNAEGTSTAFSRADHLHQGIHSLKANSGGTTRYGDLVFLPGTNITITDDGAGNFTFASTFATSFGSPVALVPDDVNTDGTLTVAARADHKHATTCDAPVTTLSPATTNAEGTTTSFSRADHTHAIATGTSGVVTTIQPDDVANSGTQNSYSRGDHRHAIVCDAPVTTLSPATTNAEGTTTSFSRADHTHAIATGTTGLITTIQPDDVANSGTQNSYARSDHRHAIVADTAVSVATTNAEGTSTSFSRADHLHQGIHSLKAQAGGTARYGDLVFLPGTNITITDDGAGNFTFASSFATSFGSPVTLVPDGGNVDGTLTVAARADHKHNIVADPPVTTLSPATTNAEGTTTSVARADHTHAIETALSGVITTIQPDDVANSGTQNSYARGDHRHAIVADVAVSVGSTNAEGTTTSFSRADHVHNITNKVKAGIVASGSFSGNPKKATVSFTAFSSVNYAIEIKGVDVRTWSYDLATKATTGFVINSNANAALSGEVSWTATENGG